MPVKNLVRLANRFATGATASELIFGSARAEAQAFAVVTLYAEWEEFSRHLVYASAAAKPIASDGRRIARAPGVRNYRDVDLSLKAWKRTRPNKPLVLHLGSPRTMVEACKYLALVNEQVIAPAILSQGSPANELRLVRNFLAHQNPSTARQVNSGPQGGLLEVPSLIAWLAQTQAGGRTRFGVWVSDLSAVARACAN